MAKQSFAAIILIAAGLLLFLEQMDIIYLSKGDYFIYGAIIGGVFLFINGINRTDKKGVLAGSFFFSFGIVLWLMSKYYFVHDDEFGIATFFLCLSLANFLYFLFRRDRVTNIVFGLIFGLIGGGFLIAYVGYYPGWMIYDQFQTYWPVALILFGLAILYKASRNNQSVSL